MALTMQSTRSLLVFGVLALLMVLTRFPPAATAVHLYDASWAVYFVAGFYLAARWRWAFPALMTLAVAVDYAAIRYMNVSNYCVTVAYWFLIPTHATLWLGGAWLRQHEHRGLRGAGLLLVSLLLSTSLAFLISNGSFYWIGDHVVNASWSGWWVNLKSWYPSFLGLTAAYVMFVATVHAILAGSPGPRVRTEGA